MRWYLLLATRGILIILPNKNVQMVVSYQLSILVVAKIQLTVVVDTDTLLALGTDILGHREEMT